MSSSDLARLQTMGSANEFLRDPKYVWRPALRNCRDQLVIMAPWGLMLSVRSTRVPHRLFSSPLSPRWPFPALLTAKDFCACMPQQRDPQQALWVQGFTGTLFGTPGSQASACERGRGTRTGSLWARHFQIRHQRRGFARCGKQPTTPTKLSTGSDALRGCVHTTQPFPRGFVRLA
ncbi:hypothetical protein VTI74DRAFT_11074 [Chaetomium olivicolor]